MPRNGSGVMSKPPNTTAQPNTTILSAMFNAVIDDIIADLNNPRPITAGGTGASSVEGARAGLGIDQKFIISSKNSAYTADASNNNGMIIVTAAATIAIDTAATLGSGWHTIVAADGGVATLDPSGSQKINGALTLVLQDGQSAFVYCTGSIGDEFSAIVFNGSRRPFSEKSAGYTIGLADDGGEVVFTAAATAGIDAVATLGAGFRVRVRATNGDVVIDPNSSEQINGAATLILKTGQTADITGNGTLFRADVHADTLSGPQLQGFMVGLALSRNVGDTTNDIDIGQGSASADASPWNLMQLASTLTKRMDAAWAVGNNAGGWLDGASMPNGNGYLFLMQRSDTGVVDVGASASLSPALPTNYDRKKLIGQFTRASLANGVPSSAVGPLAFAITDGTTVTPSGSAVTIGSLPAGIQVITLALDGVTLSGAANPMFQLGTSGGIVSSGYNAVAGVLAAGAGSILASSAGFITDAGSSTSGPLYGEITFKRKAKGDTVWTVSGHLAHGSTRVGIPNGDIDIGAELTQVRLTTAAGSVTLGGASTLTARWRTN